MGNPKLPQLDVLYQAGINPKTGLPLKFGNVKFNCITCIISLENPLARCYNKPMFRKYLNKHLKKEGGKKYENKYQQFGSQKEKQEPGVPVHQ